MPCDPKMRLDVVTHALALVRALQPAQQALGGTQPLMPVDLLIALAHQLCGLSDPAFMARVGQVVQVVNSRNSVYHRLLHDVQSVAAGRGLLEPLPEGDPVQQPSTRDPRVAVNSIGTVVHHQPGQSALPMGAIPAQPMATQVVMATSPELLRLAIPPGQAAPTPAVPIAQQMPSLSLLVGDAPPAAPPPAPVNPAAVFPITSPFASPLLEPEGV